MGFLGLDQTPVKDDNMFQRMFWPSDNAGDTDTLGKQGFWICFAIGVLSGLILVGHGQLFTGLFTAFFFCVGGMGVREHSQPAAIFVAIAYAMNIFESIVQGRLPGVFTLFLTLLLIANIRATHIAAKWATNGDPAMMPERQKDTLGDLLVDQMPQIVWPNARFPFFVLGAIYLIVTLLGAVMIAMGVPQRLQM